MIEWDLQIFCFFNFLYRIDVDQRIDLTAWSKNYEYPQTILIRSGSHTMLIQYNESVFQFLPENQKIQNNRYDNET